MNNKQTYKLKLYLRIMYTTSGQCGMHVESKRRAKHRTLRVVTCEQGIGQITCHLSTLIEYRAKFNAKK